MDLIKKLNSVGGINKYLLGKSDRRQVINDLTSIEELFGAKLPTSYKDLYKEAGAFSFNELVTVTCIDSSPIVLPGKKLSIGNFYSVKKDDLNSIYEIIETYREQIADGLLPICDGELGDVICLSLRKEDHGYIYYFHHESQPNEALFLIARNFEDLINNLETHDGSDDDDEIVKNMKVTMSPEMVALLKRDGYHIPDDVAITINNNTPE